MIDTFAHLVRTSCDGCRSRKLVWMTAVELLGSLPFAERGPARQLVIFMGADATSWRCLNCGQYGVFSSEMFAA